MTDDQRIDEEQRRKKEKKSESENGRGWLARTFL